MDTAREGTVAVAANFEDSSDECLYPLFEVSSYLALLLTTGISVKLGWKATRVCLDGKGGVCVNCADRDETLRSRAVVVAVPLSILQDGDIEGVPGKGTTAQAAARCDRAPLIRRIEQPAETEI